MYTYVSNYVTNMPNFFLLYRLYKNDKAYEDKNKGALFFVIIFEIMLFIFTLAIIPLLFLQILDCYEWTCVFSDEFCEENSDPYKLSLVQSIISICFILSIFAAQYLASTITTKDFSTLLYPEVKKNFCGCE